MNLHRINLTAQTLENFCHKWQIVELSFFGSVLRDDFDDKSDLDILVRFEDDAPWTILDLTTMQQELEALVHRKVDLIEKKMIESSQNWIRRNEILESAELVYSESYEIA